MKIDELISDLESVREEHGNLEVGVQSVMDGIRPLTGVEKTFAAYSLRQEFNISNDEKAEILRLRSEELDKKHRQITGQHLED